jgi:archaeal type IV pilus assembly protein PilA
MKKMNENAVSPVVAVMLMLVVTIIIAAIVSAFAGGSVSGVKKVPQASIQGKFSVSNGLEIIHNGGDSLGTADIVFIIRDGSMFGPNLEQKTSQTLNRTLISNDKGQYLDNGAGGSDVNAFLSGDTLFISSANATCSLLQPTVYASTSPNLCISNTTNVGKTFSLEVSDKKGNLISITDVTISP